MPSVRCQYRTVQSTIEVAAFAANCRIIQQKSLPLIINKGFYVFVISHSCISEINADALHYCEWLWIRAAAE